MAFLRLRSVTCNQTSGGRIQLQIGSNILLDYFQIATTDEPLPKTVDFSTQLLTVPFVGIVAIDLYDETVLVESGNSVASSTAITTRIISLDNRSVVYENSACVGNYMVTYDVDNDFPGLVLALLTTVGTAITTIALAVVTFFVDLIVLISRPFTRFFGDRGNQNDRAN